MDCSTPGLPMDFHSWSLLRLKSTESVMLSNHLILCHSIILLPSISPSMTVFSIESLLCIRWPNIEVSASASVLTMNIQVWFPLVLIDWISLQCKGPLVIFSSTTVQNNQFIQCSTFFIVQLSHPYMSTGNTIDLTRQTYVGKVMSLLLNKLSRLDIAFLPRVKCLLISWFKSPSTVILEPKIIVSHCFHCFPIHLPWTDGTRCHDLSFLNVEI